MTRLARLSDRLFDRLRHRDAFAVDDDNATSGDLSALRGHKYALLVTFRRSGEPVPSPVWIALDGNGVGYIKTAVSAGKTKRVARDNRAVVAPCTRRGKPTGPAIRCTARLLPEPEWPHAEATLSAAFGAVRSLTERVVGGSAESAYIEISAPRPPT